MRRVRNVIGRDPYLSSCPFGPPPATAIDIVVYDLFEHTIRGLLSHLNRAVEYSAFFNQQHRRNHVSVDAARFANLYLRPGNQIAMKRAVYDADADIHLSFDVTRFSYHKGSAFGRQLAIHLAVNLQPVGKNYVARDLYATTYPAEI